MDQLEMEDLTCSKRDFIHFESFEGSRVRVHRRIPNETNIIYTIS